MKTKMLTTGDASPVRTKAHGSADLSFNARAFAGFAGALLCSGVAWADPDPAPEPSPELQEVHVTGSASP